MRFPVQHSVLGGDTFPESKNTFTCKKNHRNTAIIHVTFNNPVHSLMCYRWHKVIKATHPAASNGRKNLRRELNAEVLKQIKKGREWMRLLYPSTIFYLSTHEPINKECPLIFRINFYLCCLEVCLFPIFDKKGCTQRKLLDRLRVSANNTATYWKTQSKKGTLCSSMRSK